MPTVAAQYLQQYGETESQFVPLQLLTRSFERGLAIPLRGESVDDLIALLNSLRRLLDGKPFSTIAVAVINSVATPSSAEVQANRLLREFLEQSGVVFKNGFGHQVFSKSLEILWVDRFIDRPFGDKEGVGLARKIGCDVLLSINTKGVLKTPFLWTTDADATLPKSYFDTSEPDSVALHYPYRHSLHSFEGGLALTLYEIHLRNYFLGLLWARSPFAFPSIGSCLAIAPDSYAKVRGFPKRQAGEDFHLLSKLRKMGPIRYQKSEPILLKGRFSARVPFGTGQSTIAIHQLLSEKTPYTIYSPRSFVFLKELLFSANTLLGIKEDIFHQSFDIFRERLRKEKPETLRPLELLSFFETLNESFVLRKTPEQRLRHFHTSFDGLKTLRLIHLLEEHAYKPEPWDQALKESPFLKLDKGNSAEGFLKEMQMQEEKSLDTLLVPFPGL